MSIVSGIWNGYHPSLLSSCCGCCCWFLTLTLSLLLYPLQEVNHLRDLLLERDQQLANVQAEVVVARAALSSAGVEAHAPGGGGPVGVLQEQLAQRSMQLLTAQVMLLRMLGSWPCEAKLHAVRH